MQGDETVRGGVRNPVAAGASTCEGEALTRHTFHGRPDFPLICQVCGRYWRDTIHLYTQADRDKR